MRKATLMLAATGAALAATALPSAASPNGQRGNLAAERPLLIRKVVQRSKPGVGYFSGSPTRQMSPSLAPLVLGPFAMPSASHDFLAMGNTNTATIITGTPPDPNGAVGPSYYVETVNGGIEVFNKAGTVVQAAKLVRTLWTGYTGVNPGNGCATRNDGDPIVRYDQLADRWVISQFSLPNENTAGGPSFQCVAVSKSSDPTGAYWLYDFKYDVSINDYGKLGVWPDAYYATYNMFDKSGGSFAYTGVDICAWDRAKMLAGQTATQQCTMLGYPASGDVFGILPANVVGSIPPPPGSPEYLLMEDHDGLNKLYLWKYHVDWATPANTTLSSPVEIPVTAFTEGCSENCVPQGGVAGKLDGLGDRLMDRVTYRNFGDHESVFAEHTVTAGAGTGIRWYELRSPGSSPTVFQQGTYAPADTNWRWMGSMAADQAQDMVLGFSLSSTTKKPSIAWTGRLAGDTLGQMGQGETILDTGAGTESGATRWGDYSSMTVDPSDDCTFWYVNELYNITLTYTWDTRIASVKFPNCAQNDFTLAPSPDTVTAVQGGQGATTIDTTVTAGTAENVGLYVNGLPAGASAGFSPAAPAAGTSSTLTLTAGAATPPGSYPITVIGHATSAVHATSLTFTVTAAPPPPPPPPPAPAPPSPTERPGRGNGDKNHRHTGPPGKPPGKR
jgi:hypothetical protein